MTSDQLRVLVVDDEESYRVQLQKFLESRFGFAVEVAADGIQALRCAEQCSCGFDVALIDQSLMKGPPGFEVARRLKALCPDIETIALTGWGLDDGMEAIESGVFRYLEKSHTTSHEIALLARSAGQQSRLRVIGRSILMEYSLDRLLQLIASAAQSLTSASEVAISLCTKHPKHMRIFPEITAGDVKWTRHFRTGWLSDEIMRTGRPVQVLDTRRDVRIDPALVQAGICAFVGVPIPGREGNLGVLYAYQRTADRFDSWGTQTLLQTLAAQAGLAIANSQTLSEQQQLYSLGNELTTTLELEEVLERVAVAARRSGGCRACDGGRACWQRTALQLWAAWRQRRSHNASTRDGRTAPGRV